MLHRIARFGGASKWTIVCTCGRIFTVASRERALSAFQYHAYWGDRRNRVTS